MKVLQTLLCDVKQLINLSVIRNLLPIRWSCIKYTPKDAGEKILTIFNSQFLGCIFEDNIKNILVEIKIFGDA
jgi:hypothetical protein